MMPLQQNLYNGLAHLADYSIFARECWHRNGRLICRKAYWPTTILVGKLMLVQDRRQDEQQEHWTDELKTQCTCCSYAAHRA